jgi:hypothetical protein
MIGYLVNGIVRLGADMMDQEENVYGFGNGDGWGSGYNEPEGFDFHGGGPSLYDGEEDGFGTGGGGWEEARYSDEGEGFGCGYGSPGGGEDGLMQWSIRRGMGDMSQF